MLRRLLCAALPLAVAACSAGPWPAVAPPACGETGQASWYRPGTHRTAAGREDSTRALTAAHRSLPFDTRVRVTDLDNGRTVVVRIDDRGPFVRGRIIDLSPAAARVIGMRRDGVAPVRLDLAHPVGAASCPFGRAGRL